jgi:transposase InsO family protein
VTVFLSAFYSTGQVLAGESDHEIRTKAVVFYEERIRSAKEIGETYNISERTVRRWSSLPRQVPENGLRPKKTGPKQSSRATSASLEQRIIRLKEKYPAWGARWIKHQFNFPSSWRTVHRILKKHGLLIRIKAKPQPSGKRFQRKHVDSMWQGDTFQFRIRNIGKVYVTGFTNDCSRYRVRSKVHLHKDAASAVNALQWALRNARIPREIYVDNGKQFISKTFKAEARKYGISLIFGRPYNPRGCSKIERYHEILYRELVALKEFRSLSHFKRELWNFDHQYNNWRKQEILDWMTQALVYHNEINFNKNQKHLSSGHKFCQQNGY